MITFVRVLVLAALSLNLWAATFGTPVSIGGQASDIALDEPRGVLYIANFTANRIDILTLSDLTVHRSMNVNPQPGSLSLSPDGNNLVVVHFGNTASPGTSNNSLTVIHLADGTRQAFGLAFPPLGVAFGRDGRALIATTTDFELFDPVSGVIQVLTTFTALAAKTLPVPLANFPPNVIAASLNSNTDKTLIVGLADTIYFAYDVRVGSISAINYTASPLLAPRVVSVSADGTSYIAGWALNLCGGSGTTGCTVTGPLSASFVNPSGILNIGSHALDSASNTVYAEVPATATDKPVLAIDDADNLVTRERLQLPEHLAGKSVLSADATVMYSISDSGVMVLPVGSLNRVHRVQATTEDIIFRGDFCNRGVATQTLTIVDLAGGNVPFSLSTSMQGVTFSASSAVTPATITVKLDSAQYANQLGTVAGTIAINAPGAVNVPPTVRLLVNTRQPDQRGTIIDLPGQLVDLLADPGRDRFYVLRQDKGLVYVFDGTYNQIATFRTGTTPTQMAITMDDNYLIVGHDNSQLAYVYDLNSLQRVSFIQMPFGHYPRSIAVSSRSILAANRVAGPVHMIDRIDFASGTATPFPSLGVFNNNININTVLQGTPNGTAIMGAMADGNLLLYDATVDSFTISRKDTAALSGAYAASAFGQFVVGNKLYNSSLVALQSLSTAATSTTGFAFGPTGAMLTGPGPAAGVIQRFDTNALQASTATRVAEATAPNATGFAFTRTLAPLSNGNAIVELTTSGLLILPANFDAAVAPPQISAIVNAADLTKPVAPGGLVSMFGSNFSPINIATSQIPLPTALAESCLAVNGGLVPLIFASPSQINAQLPFSALGNSTLVLYTPGGVSDTFNFSVQPNAPSVFRAVNGTATIIRDIDGKYITPDTPIHLNQYLTIYLTGLGVTSPSVAPGNPAPSSPMSAALVQPTITIGGTGIFVLSANLAPNQVGVYQIKALVPFRNVPTGDSVPFKITQGSYSTTIMLKVSE
jgi:uncharacterized protein (TIGR03437 family)